MSKTISWTIPLAIFLSLSTTISGKTCTQEHLNRYVVHRMNPYTQRLITATEVKKSIIIVCCAGYQEISRSTTHTTCMPVCQNPCNHGICYGPNLCKCDEGYTNSEIGTCVPEEKSTIEPSVPLPVERSIRKFARKIKPKASELLTTTAATITTPTTTTTTAPTTTTTTTSPTTTTTTTAPTTTTTTTTSPTTTTSTALPMRDFNFRGSFSSEGHPKPKSTFEYRQPECSPPCLNGWCKADNHCECLDGYTFDSELLQCKPLCNGKIYGCIHGTCVGYNQCRCNNGTGLLNDELFHCQSLEQGRSLKQGRSLEQGKSLDQNSFNWMWYLLVLVIPAVVVFLSFYIIIRRWRRVKTNRLEAQGAAFSEVRYFNSDNDHSVNEKHKFVRQEQHSMDGPSCSNTDTIRRNGNVVIINT